MCGEHVNCGAGQNSGTGSSPHVRGAHVDDRQTSIPIGIIPACAGSTCIWRSWIPAPRDHPRMCGEHILDRLEREGCLGSSPHVRGARDQQQRRRTPPGIIPACAGSTPWGILPPARRWDHPRMCGEHGVRPDLGQPAAGSSPHVRGARLHDTRTSLFTGIIPACAGSTCLECGGKRERWDHPRMCGEH